MLDLTKPVQTRDGRKVRILCTDRRGGLYPVLGLVTDDRGIETSHCWTLTGDLVVGEHGFPNDLINVPPPKTKVKVEVRICRHEGRRYIFCSENGEGFGPFAQDPLASTTIEMEYEEQP